MARVDFPDDSGPKISTTRPRGRPADPEGDVEGEGARRDGLDLHVEVLAHAHDGAFAELLLDLPHRHIEGLVSLHRSPFLSLLIGTGAHPTNGV